MQVRGDGFDQVGDPGDAAMAAGDQLAEEAPPAGVGHPGGDLNPEDVHAPGRAGVRAITLTYDFDGRVIPNDWISLTLRRELTLSRSRS